MTPEELAAKIAKHPELAAKPTYIAYCPKCRGMDGCIVDTPEPRDRKEIAKFTADYIKHGYTVKHKTNADVWGGTWCDCKKKQQASLF